MHNQGTKRSKATLCGDLGLGRRIAGLRLTFKEAFLTLDLWWSFLFRGPLND